MAKHFTRAIQERVLRLAATANIKDLLDQCGVSFTLGSIGVALNHCASVEANERILSPVLTSVFREALVQLGVSREKASEQAEPVWGHWSWNELERIENALK